MYTHMLGHFRSMKLVGMDFSCISVVTICCTPLSGDTNSGLVERSGLYKTVGHCILGPALVFDVQDSNLVSQRFRLV
jgi:hypothetical protein